MRPSRLSDARTLPVAALLLALGVAGASAERAVAHAAGCGPRFVSPAYERSLARTLDSGQDLLGERLLRLPGGPTYAAAAKLVPPLLFARTSRQRPLTSSGVYYVPSAQPGGDQGAGAPMLLLADGSEARYGSVGGAALTVRVEDGERFGACLRRSGAARLSRLPADRADVLRRCPRPALPTGGIRGTAADGATAAYLEITGGPAIRDPCRLLAASRPAIWAPRRSPRAVPIDGAEYARARASVVSYWQNRLAEGASIAGSRGARHECAARVADPEPDAHVALQHRQPLRGVLVPGEPRRRPGARRVRLGRVARAIVRTSLRGGPCRTRPGRWPRSSLRLRPHTG